MICKGAVSGHNVQACLSGWPTYLWVGCNVLALMILLFALIWAVQKGIDFGD